MALVLLACGDDEAVDLAGVGAYLVALEPAGGDAAPFVIEVAYGATRFELGAAPTMIDIAPDGTRTPTPTPFVLQPGATLALDRFLGWHADRGAGGQRARVGAALWRVRVVAAGRVGAGVGGALHRELPDARLRRR